MEPLTQLGNQGVVVLCFHSCFVMFCIWGKQLEFLSKFLLTVVVKCVYQYCVIPAPMYVLLYFILSFVCSQYFEMLVCECARDQTHVCCLFSFLCWPWDRTSFLILSSKCATSPVSCCWDSVVWEGACMQRDEGRERRKGLGGDNQGGRRKGRMN